MVRNIVIQATAMTASEDAAARAMENLSRAMIGLALDGEYVGTGVTVTTVDDEEGESGAA